MRFSFYRGAADPRQRQRARGAFGRDRAPFLELASDLVAVVGYSSDAAAGCLLARYLASDPIQSQPSQGLEPGGWVLCDCCTSRCRKRESRGFQKLGGAQRRKMGIRMASRNTARGRRARDGAGEVRGISLELWCGQAKTKS